MLTNKKVLLTLALALGLMVAVAAIAPAPSAPAPADENVITVAKLFHESSPVFRPPECPGPGLPECGGGG